MGKTQELILAEDPGFSSLEETREISIHAAHRTIVRLAKLAALSEAGARQLRVLTEIVNDAELLEIKRFVTMERLNRGGRPKGEEK